MSFIDLSKVNSKEVVPGFTGRFVHSEKISVAYWDVKAGSSIPVHQHVHEMMVNIISGNLELTIGEETKVLEPGMVGVIPGNVPHTARALTDCKLIDVFYPVREDYKI